MIINEYQLHKKMNAILDNQNAIAEMLTLFNDEGKAVEQRRQLADNIRGRCIQAKQP